ncbi:FAD-dependent oxidoreductase [Myxococcus sp. SDU36]|nr:FAD-dependent oxidoreductase [Myxococcus sp. SDU36]
MDTILGAGLAAAQALVLAGQDVVVLEARSRPCGPSTFGDVASWPRR